MEISTFSINSFAQYAIVFILSYFVSTTQIIFEKEKYQSNKIIVFRTFVFHLYGMFIGLVSLYVLFLFHDNNLFPQNTIKQYALAFAIGLGIQGVTNLSIYEYPAEKEADSGESNSEKKSIGIKTVTDAIKSLLDGWISSAFEKKMQQKIESSLDDVFPHFEDKEIKQYLYESLPIMTQIERFAAKGDIFSSQDHSELIKKFIDEYGYDRYHLFIKRLNRIMKHN